MTERELQQQKEIERLQKKVRELSEAYNCSIRELNELKDKQTIRKKGRPEIDSKVKARIVSLYQNGKTMREIAADTERSLGLVQKIVAQAIAESRMIYVYMDREKIATLLDICGITQKIRIYNFTDDMVSRAFGINEKPDWEALEEFFESRCMPRTRYGIREELKFLGIESYDPFLIIEKTEGRVYGDEQYLRKMDSEWIAQYCKVMKKAGTQEQKKQHLLEFLENTDLGVNG